MHGSVRKGTGNRKWESGVAGLAYISVISSVSLRAAKRSESEVLCVDEHAKDLENILLVLRGEIKRRADEVQRNGGPPAPTRLDQILTKDEIKKISLTRPRTVKALIRRCGSRHAIRLKNFGKQFVDRISQYVKENGLDQVSKTAKHSCTKAINRGYLRVKV